MSLNDARQFHGWAAESRLAGELCGVYGKNPAQLRALWANLPEATKIDPDVRATVALCFLRLADPESAKSVDPAAFAVDEGRLLGPVATHRIARWLLRLYLKKLKVVYGPAAWLLNLYFRRFTDAQLLLNMYFKVWSNNSLGLQFILPLFARSITRSPSPDRHRNICFFGYIAALNCIMDDGIEVMEREMRGLAGYAGTHPHEFWMQEMSLLLAMVSFYNLDYARATALHRQVADRSIGDASFLFVRTMNHGSWLRLAAVDGDQVGFETISKTLQEILQSDYDKRFALRTHSYRSLIAARRQERDRCLQELALANSISDKNPWGLEYCNHFGVTAKVYLYNGMPEQALDAARRYLMELAKTNFQSSFLWEANVLALKCVVINRLVVPAVRRDDASLADLAADVHRVVARYAGMSRRWRELYEALRRLVIAAEVSPSHAMAVLQRLHVTHPGQFDEMLFALQPREVFPAPSFDRAVQQATQALRFNRELLTYIQQLRQTDHADFDASRIIGMSRPILSLLLPGGDVSVTIDDADADVNAGVALAAGITEMTTSNGFCLTIGIDIGKAQGSSRIVVKGYSEALNFRRDILASLTLWREATENAIREERLRQSEFEQEKSAAITKTTQMLAHDVRKPFSLMEGMLSMLRQGVDQQVVGQFHDEVRIAIAAVNGMLADIMEIGATRRVSEGDAASIFKAISSAIIHNVALMRRSDVRFVYRFGHKHEPSVEESRVVRAFANVIGNALQAMKYKGVITITSVEENGHVVVTIHNTGSFIKPEHQTRVFEPFFTHGKRDGTGLGLAIVGKIMNDCGGRISCRSHETDGTTFALEFQVTSRPDAGAGIALPLDSRQVLRPAVDVDVPAIATADQQVADRLLATVKDALQSHVQAEGRPVRVLMCDDEDFYAVAVRAHLVELLSDPRSLVFDKCHSAEDAVSRVAVTRYDLVILDVDLKGSAMNGFELSHEVRALLPFAFICIHSNRGKSEFHMEAQRSGANLFLPKPMHRIHLLQILTETIQKTRPRGYGAC